MKSKIIKSILLLVFFIPTLFLYSCGVDKADYEKIQPSGISKVVSTGGLAQKDDGITSGGININDNTLTIPMDVLEEEHWSRIDNFAEDIGRSLPEVFDALKNIPNYNWYGGDSQSMDEEDTAIYYYSGPAWQQGSKCTAIKISGYECLPDTWDNSISEDMIRDYFSDRYTYHPPSKELNGYFEFDFKDLSVIFYENNESKLLKSDFCVLIRSASEPLPINAIAALEMKDYTINSKLLLNGDKWKRVKELSEYIRMKAKDIDGTVVDKSTCKEDGDSPIDSYHIHDKTKPGVVYYLSSDDSQNHECYEVISTAEYALDMSNIDIISMSDLVNYYRIPFSWSYYDSYFYYYDFGDIVVYIYSDDEFGNINKDDIVQIKELNFRAQ